MAEGRASGEALVTIRDLLDDPDLDLKVVEITSAGLAAPVSWVHATEQLDPRPHLRPSELVCTLGSALVRPRASKAFVAAVAETGAAGICLGLGEVHLEPPAELTEACRRAGVPLLQMPHGIPFLSVNDSVRRRRSEAESEARRAEAALLGSLLDSAREGTSEDRLLTMASRALRGTLTWRDEVPRRSPDAVDSIAGSRIAWAGEGPAPSDVFLLQLASVLDVASREREREQVESHQRLGQLFDLIGDRLAHPAVLLPEIETLGLDRSRLRVSSWPAGSEGAVTARWPKTLIGTTERDVIVVSEPNLATSIEDPRLVCGYSEVVPLTGLSGGVREARAALRLARSRGGVIGPEQLVSLDALLEQQPIERLVPFVDLLLAPIMRADEDGRGDLLNTLRAFVHSERNLQSTATRLFVHVNTVRHRLGRVHELSGRDPLSLTGISDLQIALWVVERRETTGVRMIRPLN